MKTAALTMIAAVLGLTGAGAGAQESPWQLRARAVHIDTANHADPVGGIGAADRIHVSNKTIPELDISYFFTPQLAAELILTYPQKHAVRLDGTRIGSLRHLPPTLTLQYHFAPGQALRPYVGAGVNYTRLSRVRLLDGAGGLENDSWGLAAQAGVDFRIAPQWSLNVDIKKVQIRSDVFVGGARASAVKVDPLLLGIGVGYRF
ncbi:OmpW/AlkL family protein [Massilia sp. GCM10023247]|uniref:OmpW/AlkL family protein n=1 Tax=Massilia sp. GCM10023247 TaxID=3252643 RepID=UPI00361C7A41